VHCRDTAIYAEKSLSCSSLLTTSHNSGSLAKMCSFVNGNVEYDSVQKPYIVANGFRPRMIVFDKDGTLLDQAPALKSWAALMTNNLKEELLSLGQEAEMIESNALLFHEAIGWDDVSESLVPSAPLAAVAWAEQLDTYAKLFGKMGIADASAKALSWHNGMGTLHGNDAPVIDDLRGLMEQCRAYGLIVAIATSDDRPATDLAMTNYNLNDVVDVSIWLAC
jgi:phosphoglycolate phosphatase-like HAD superfamily hydrolase